MAITMTITMALMQIRMLLHKVILNSLLLNSSHSVNKALVSKQHMLKQPKRKQLSRQILLTRVFSKFQVIKQITKQGLKPGIIRRVISSQ